MPEANASDLKRGVCGAGNGENSKKKNWAIILKWNESIPAWVKIQVNHILSTPSTLMIAFYKLHCVYPVWRWLSYSINSQKGGKKNILQVIITKLYNPLRTPLSEANWYEDRVFNSSNPNQPPCQLS